MSRLLLVRHGNTKLNSAERFWGQTDVELGDEGIRQAEQLRDRLATEKIDAVYASNLRRTMKTAEIIVSRHKVDITTCAELREIDFGKVEGLTFAEISQLYPDLAKSLAAWKLQTRFPDGESREEFSDRVHQFLPRLEKHTPEETVMIVAHSGTMRMLICYLMGLEIWHWRQFRISLGSLSIIDSYPQGAILSLLNDVSHQVSPEVT
ncbi:alpha-ribazole phosphatase [Chloroflexota bacterium]